MKLIEALKKVKDLSKKAEDLQEKIAKYSAYLNYETPAYENQKGQVKEWIQGHSDVLKEILRLRIAIQKTNLETEVSIQLNGKAVKKCIAEWIHRRRDLAGMEMQAWRSLTDRGLKEGTVQQSTGEKMEVKIIRCYDPKERDEKVLIYSEEPSLIDAQLEVVNAVTDLIE